MAAPTIVYWQVTAPGNGNINQLNVGGPTASLLTGTTPFDLGSCETAVWSVPQVLLMGFNGNTARSLSWSIYDEVTDLGEHFFAGFNPSDELNAASWVFHFDLKAAYVDPATIGTSPGSSPINSWARIPWTDTTDGGNTTAVLLDSIWPTPGNDTTSSTNGGLITQIGTSGNYVTNFFIYVSAKPRTAATAGVNLQWGWQLNYVYP